MELKGLKRDENAERLNLIKKEKADLENEVKQDNPSVAAAIEADQKKKGIMEAQQQLRIDFGKAVPLSKFGARYRRREDMDRDKLVKSEAEKKKIEELGIGLNGETDAEVKAALERAYQKQAEALDQQLKAAEAVSKEKNAQAQALPGAKGFSTDQIARNKQLIRENMQKRIAELAAQIAQMEATAEQAWKAQQQTKPKDEQEDRPIDDLYGDINKSLNHGKTLGIQGARWVCDWGEDRSSSETVQRLEHAQNESKDPAYADVVAYFLFSKTRGQAIYLERLPQEPGKPIKWHHKYYYKMCPKEKVFDIFRSMKGDTITKLKDCPIDKNLFADVF